MVDHLIVCPVQSCVDQKLYPQCLGLAVLYVTGTCGAFELRGISGLCPKCAQRDETDHHRTQRP